jgi:uncharacterized membrane protein
MSSYNSRVAASFGIISALMVLLNVIVVPVPPPIQYVGFAAVLIYFVGVMFKPARAFWLCAVGSTVGQILTSIYLGQMSTLVEYAVGAFVARGGEGLLISGLVWVLIRKKKNPPLHQLGLEIAILCIGCTYEVLGYYIVGGPYDLIVSGIPLLVDLFAYLPTFIDMVFVPVGIAVIYAARRQFQMQYLDSYLFNDVVETPVAQ